VTATAADDKPRGIKARLGLIPLRALWPVADVFEGALAKYRPRTWSAPNDDAVECYAEAAARHVLAYLDGEHLDSDTGRSHLAHGAASLLIAVWHEAGYGAGRTSCD